MKRKVLIGEKSYTLTLASTPAGPAITVGTDPITGLSRQALDGGAYQFKIGRLNAEANVVAKGEHVFIEAFGRHHTITVLDPVEQAHAAAETGDLNARSPMPGVIVELHVALGDHIETGQPLLTIESMKLFTLLCASGSGIVEAINYGVDDTFNKGALLVQIQAPGDENA